MHRNCFNTHFILYINFLKEIIKITFLYELNESLDFSTPFLIVVHFKAYGIMIIEYTMSYYTCSLVLYYWLFFAKISHVHFNPNFNHCNGTWTVNPK